MNIAIIGYGKMGKMIADTAEKRGHQIGLIIDMDNAHDLNAEKLKDIDVAIEFSSPKSGYNNIKTCILNHIPVVSGTTGWLDKWSEISDLCKKEKTALFYASNYSIGMNILFAINSKLASIMNRFPEYDVSMEEVHHIHKLDEPSGTAITLAEQIIHELDSKQAWTLQENSRDKIHIKTRREGEVNGFHSVSYSSEVDAITISHDAASRQGFATGAVMAAEFLPGKTGIFSMKELLNL